MIEVLVSILVLSIGVVGAAGMQLAAFRTTQQSGYQTMALQLAADIADAVRTNAMHVARGRDVLHFVDIDYRSSIDTDPPRPKLCYATPCGPAEFADFQLYEWKLRMKSAFPGARLRICRDSMPWDGVRRSFRWECNGGDSFAAPIVIKLGWPAKNPDGSPVGDADDAFPPGIVFPVGSA